MKSYKWLIALAGVLLGFGAPLGSILCRAIEAGPFSLEWIRHEVRSHSFYYGYMTFATPLIFAIFGGIVGHLIDRFFQQKAYLESLNLQLKEQSIMDDLTGLYNHRHIMTEIDKEIERARRYSHQLSGMMLDLDDFKRFNDSFGHLVGDAILRESAKVFESSVRKIDILGRYGGDEFLIILPESGIENARIVAERIRKNMGIHDFRVKQKPVKVTVSIGLFSFGDLSELEATGFIEKVDKALLKAKAQGKNRVISIDET